MSNSEGYNVVAYSPANDDTNDSKVKEVPYKGDTGDSNYAVEALLICLGVALLVGIGAFIFYKMKSNAEPESEGEEKEGDEEKKDDDVEAQKSEAVAETKEEAAKEEEAPLTSNNKDENEEAKE